MIILNYFPDTKHPVKIRVLSRFKYFSLKGNIMIEIYAHKDI